MGVSVFCSAVLGVSVGANLGVSVFRSAVLGVSAGANLNVSDFCSAVLVSVLISCFRDSSFQRNGLGAGGL